CAADHLYARSGLRARQHGRPAPVQVPTVRPLGHDGGDERFGLAERQRPDDGHGLQRALDARHGLLAELHRVADKLRGGLDVQLPWRGLLLWWPIAHRRSRPEFLWCSPDRSREPLFPVEHVHATVQHQRGLRGGWDDLGPERPDLCWWHAGALLAAW